MRAVFISYAEEDGNLAMRLHEDLERLRFVVWRYEAHGRVGVDFVEEYRQQIEATQVFCLIDSPHSRKSYFVKEECLLARELEEKRGLPQFVSCSENRSNRWRKKELFEGQNRMTYIDFTAYGRGIRDLCEFLGVNYSPFSKIPRDLDFREEIYGITGLDWRDRQKLIDDYAYFRIKFEEDKRLAESLLVTINARCADFNIQIISPYLALGVLQAEAGRHRDALDTFTEASTIFPADPRVWAGIAGAQYYLSCYESVRKTYEKCRSLVNESANENHKSHLTEVVHNLAQVLFVLGETDQALAELNHLPDTEQQRPETLSLMGRILMSKGETERALSYLKRANESEQSASLMLDIADCYGKRGELRKQYEMLNRAAKAYPNDAEVSRSLAVYFANQAQFDSALRCMERAVDLFPNKITYRAELALLFNLVGASDELDKQVKACLSLAVSTYADHYYLGLIYYITRRVERALDEFEYAKKDKKLTAWPYYDALVAKNLLRDDWRSRSRTEWRD